MPPSIASIDAIGSGARSPCLGRSLFLQGIGGADAIRRARPAYPSCRYPELKEQRGASLCVCARQNGTLFQDRFSLKIFRAQTQEEHCRGCVVAEHPKSSAFSPGDGCRFAIARMANNAFVFGVVNPGHEVVVVLQ